MASAALRGAVATTSPVMGTLGTVTLPLTLPPLPTTQSPALRPVQQSAAAAASAASVAVVVAAATARTLRQAHNGRRKLGFRCTVAAATTTVARGGGGVKGNSPQKDDVMVVEQEDEKSIGVAAAVGSQARFRIERRGGKGLGAVATEDIPKGTLVLFESPLLLFQGEALDMIFGFAEGGADHLLADPFLLRSWETSLESHVEETASEKWSQRDKDENNTDMVAGTIDAFWALADTSELTLATDFEKTAVGITRTNALSLGGDAAGLFLRVSRLNHSCNPNVHHHWVEEAGAEALRATRDIKAGEELCISYLSQDGLCGSTEERQAELQHQFGFHCQCEVCSSLPHGSPEKEASDRRRLRLRELDRALSRRPRQASSQESNDGPRRGGGRKIVREALELLEKEFTGNPAASALFHFAAFRRALDADLLEVAQEMAAEAHRNTVVAEGADSPRAERLKAYADDPTLFRVDMADPDEVPDGNSRSG